jgi:uncharacterized protein (DUF433 family)
MPTKSVRKPSRKVKVYGRYIVADSGICHGALTFRGTRIFVEHVLDQVAEGMDWDDIVGEWRGSVSREAIAEAVQVAKTSLLKDSRKSSRRRRAG